MRKIILALLFAAMAFPQTYTGPPQEPIAAPMRSSYQAPPGMPGFKLIDSRDMGNAFCKSASVTGTTLTLICQNDQDQDVTVAFSAVGGGMADGVLNSANYDTGTKMIALETSTGGSFTLDLSGLQNATQVQAIISSSTGNFITLANVADWAEAGNTDDIPESKIPSEIARDSEIPDPDGVVTGGSFSGSTLTLNRSQSLSNVQITGIMAGMGGGTDLTDVEQSELHQLPSVISRTDDIRLLTEPGWIAGPGDSFATSPARPSLSAAENETYTNLFVYTGSNLDANDWVTFRFMVADAEDVRNWRMVLRVTGEDPIYYSGANFIPLGTSGSFVFYTYQIRPIANAQLTAQRRNASSLMSSTHYRGQTEAEQVQGLIAAHQVSSEVSGTARQAGDLLLATGAGTAEWGTRPEEIVSGAIVPDDFVGPLFYLTHDQQTGTRDDLVINVVRVGTGTQVRWSRNSLNPMDGTTDSGDPGPLSEISGSGDPDGTFNVALVGSHAPQQLDSNVIDVIIINGNEFPLTGAYNYSASSDQYQRFINVLNVSNPLSVNFRRDDGTWWYADSTLAHRAGLYEWDPNALGGGEYVHTGVGSAQHGDINLLSIYENWANEQNRIDMQIRTYGNIYRNGGRMMRILAASAPFFSRQSGRDFDIRYFPLRRVDDDSYLTTGDGVQIGARENVPTNQQEFLQGRLDDPILVDPGQYFMVAVHNNNTIQTQLPAVYGNTGTSETNTPIQNFTYVGPARTTINSLEFEGPHQVYPTSVITSQDESVRMQIEFEVPSLPGFTDIDVNGSHLISVPSGIEFNGDPVTGSVSSDGNNAILTFAHDGALSGATCFGDNLRITRTGPTPNTFDVVDACATGGGGNTAYYAIPRSGVGGTGDAIELTTGHSLTTLQHGSLFFFESTAANTGAVTVTIDGQSITRNVQRSNGVGQSINLTGGEITAGDPVFLVYEARFGILHWLPGHQGLLSRLNAVGTNEIADGAVTDAKLDAVLRGEIHGQTSAQATYQVQGSVTSAFANSQTNWIGNIFVANVDMVVYGGRAYVNRPSGGGNANYQVHVFPINRNSDTDFRIGNTDDVFHTPADMVRNVTTGGDFDDEITVNAGSGFTELEFHTGELNGLSVAEGDYFAVAVTSRSQGRSYVVSNLDATPAEEPHVGDGDFPFAGFRWFAPFRNGTSIIGAGNNYYGSDPTRVVRMRIDYAVASASTFAGYNNGTEVYTGAAVVNCTGNGITCIENSDGQFEMNVPGITGGGTDGVVDDVTTSYSAATGEITVTLGRTVGVDISDNVELPRAGTTQAGIARFANADETALGDNDALMISPRRLAGYVAQQGPSAGYDLTYGINQTATDRDGQDAHLLGNIYRAETDGTIYRYRMRSDVPSGTSRTYTARFFKLNQVSANNYQRGTNEVMTAQSRLGTGAYSDTVTVGALATVTDVEAFIPAGFEVSDGEYFILGFSHGAASDTFLVVERGADEDSHIGHQDFPHATFSYVAKGASTSHEEPLTDSNMFGDNVFAMRMQFDYEVPALMTAAEEGTVVFLGAANINCVGAGVTCSEDSSDRLEINVPGGGAALDIDSLTNLASGDIADTDELVIYDGSASANRSITQGELAARLADGTTITSSGGTLTAVGGGGGGATLTDTTINVTSPASESTTVGASRQAIAEAIRNAEDPENLPLTYAIAQSATARNTLDGARNLGNIYQAHTDLTIQGASFRINVPTAAGSYEAYIFKAVRQGTDQFRRTGNLITSTYRQNVPANTPTTIGFVFPGQGLNVETDEFFGVVVENLGGNQLAATLEQQGGVVEETHIGLHTDIGDTISYQCKAYATVGSFGRLSLTHDWCRNSNDSTWAQVHYTLGEAGLLTLDDEGTNVYIGTPRVDCVGAGVTCSNESGRATITVPGGGSSIDLGSVTESILPDTDNAYGVGSFARTFRFGHFTEITADSVLRLGTQNMGDACVDISFSGTTLTCTQADGGTDTVTIAGGGGGGGGGGFSTTEIGSTDVNFSASNTFISTGITIPADTYDWLLVNLGAFVSGVGTRSGEWVWIRASDFFGMNAATTGALTASTHALELHDKTSSSNADIYIGRTSANVLLAAATSSAADFFPLTVLGLTAGGGGGGGDSTDLQNIAGDLLPDADDSRNVGTAARTWSNGRFTDLTIDGTLTSAAATFSGGTVTVQNDLVTQADIRISDNEQLIFGDDIDLSIDYDSSQGEVELRLGSDADQISIFDGTGVTAQHSWERNGDATVGRNLTVGGTINVSGGTTLTGNVSVGGLTVTGDLEAQNDIHLGDRDQIILGTGLDATFDYDDRTSNVEIRLNPGADSFAIYDGTGNTIRHQFNRNGTASIGGNLTVDGSLTIGTDELDEVIDDDVDDLLTAGHGVDLEYNDSTDSLTITSVAAALDAEAGTFPDPTADCEFDIAYDSLTHNLEVCTNTPHVQDAVGTWVDIPTRTDLTVEESREFISSPTLNDYVFDAGAKHFYQWTVVFTSGTTRNAWVQTTATAALAGSRTSGTRAVRFLGEQISDAAATSLLTAQAANTDYFYVRGDVIRRLSSFTAPTTTDHWEWRPVQQGLVVLKVTQAQYDGIAAKDDNVLYVIQP